MGNKFQNTSMVNPPLKGIVSKFSFKSKSIGGNNARINVIHYKNGAVYIVKVIISKDDLTRFGFELIRKFKNFGVYYERIALKKETLLTIVDGIEKEVFIAGKIIVKR